VCSGGEPAPPHEAYLKWKSVLRKGRPATHESRADPDSTESRSALGARPRGTRAGLWIALSRRLRLLGRAFAHEHLITIGGQQLTKAHLKAIDEKILEKGPAVGGLERSPTYQAVDLHVAMDVCLNLHDVVRRTAMRTGEFQRILHRVSTLTF
jgi:hypothetical protein